MRFESVTAHAFGPFQGRRLDLAPGLNVVFGPGEVLPSPGPYVVTRGSVKM